MIIISWPKSHEQVIESVMHRAIKANKSVDKNAALETAKMAKSTIDKVNLNKKLIKLMTQKK